MRVPRRWWASAASIALTALAMLAPKCPACVAVYLGVAGVGVGGASALALLLRPTLFALAGLLSALCLVVWARHLREHGPLIGDATRIRLAQPSRRWRP